LTFDWRALGTTGDTAQVGKDVVDWKREPTATARARSRTPTTTSS
jgi:hypothetical protein